jgi:hypothetical protein
LGHQGICPRNIPRDHSNFACAELVEGQNRSACRAPCAQYCGDPAAQNINTQSFNQACGQACNVGVERFDASVAKNKEVCSAGHLRRVVGLVREREGRLLMRVGDVHADKSGRAKSGERHGERFPGYRERHIGPVDAVFAQPEALQTRRKRMAHGPSYDPGDFGPTGNVHDAITP